MGISSSVLFVDPNKIVLIPITARLYVRFGESNDARVGHAIRFSQRNLGGLFSGQGKPLFASHNLTRAGYVNLLHFAVIVLLQCQNPLGFYLDTLDI
jgi:hypothetical protein